ncbi:hypothetical protein ES703_71960 [subsurface metagenome]
MLHRPRGRHIRHKTPTKNIRTNRDRRRLGSGRDQTGAVLFPGLFRPENSGKCGNNSGNPNRSYLCARRNKLTKPPGRVGWSLRRCYCDNHRGYSIVSDSLGNLGLQ